MKPPSPEQQLRGFIAKFSPAMSKLIRAARAKLRKKIPAALELVYDNYNFFVIGYGPNEKAGDAILSLAAQASGLSLCLLQGAGLPDPAGLLRGTGTKVRRIRLDTPAVLDLPDVSTLIETALQRAKTPLQANGQHRLIIKSVSAKQRPRQATASKSSGRRQ